MSKVVKTQNDLQFASFSLMEPVSAQKKLIVTFLLLSAFARMDCTTQTISAFLLLLELEWQTIIKCRLRFVIQIVANLKYLSRKLDILKELTWFYLLMFANCKYIMIHPFEKLLFSLQIRFKAGKIDFLLALPHLFRVLLCFNFIFIQLWLLYQ